MVEYDAVLNHGARGAVDGEGLAVGVHHRDAFVPRSVSVQVVVVLREPETTIIVNCLKCSRR